MSVTDDALSLEPTQAAQLLMGILSPDAVAEAEKLKDGTSELIHYTTAENAINILKSRTFWLRNARCMNDFLEVQHGLDLLLKVFGGPENPRVLRLYSILDRLSPGEAKTAVETFNTWIPRLPDITFIGCLSLAEVSESTGRLSMWRAYSSQNAGVALILDTSPFLAETDSLKAYSMPVAYLTDEQFALRIDNCLEALDGVVATLGKVPEFFVNYTVFWWLLSMAVSLKHPAFIEEREWRIVYFPEMHKSQIIEEAVETIRGIPQVVQKIPLLHDEENGLIGANPENLLKKIIVGPSEFPLVIKEAFASVLTGMGIENPSDRISVSFIPLR